jgi:hypothetical protein
MVITSIKRCTGRRGIGTILEGSLEASMDCRGICACKVVLIGEPRTVARDAEGLGGSDGHANQERQGSKAKHAHCALTLSLGNIRYTLIEELLPHTGGWGHTFIDRGPSLGAKKDLV